MSRLHELWTSIAKRNKKTAESILKEARRVGDEETAEKLQKFIEQVNEFLKYVESGE
jgi:uncharacterized FlaG/YvyC family protein